MSEMTGEVVNVAGNMASKTAEASLQTLLAILRFLSDMYRNRSIQKGQQQAMSNKESTDIAKIKGVVAAERLYKQAKENRSPVIAISEKISAEQLKELNKRCSQYGISYSVIQQKNDDKTIRQLESAKTDFEKKAQPLHDEIDKLNEERENIFLSKENSNQTLSAEEDNRLKEIYNEISLKQQQIDNMEYLTEEEKANYKAIDERLNGNNETKGLRQMQNEATVLIQDKDKQIFLEVIKEMNRNQMEKNIDNKLLELSNKEKLSPEEETFVEQAKKEKAKIQEERAKEFNNKTKEEVFSEAMESIQNNENSKGTEKNVIEAFNRCINENRQNDNNTYICNMSNPNNYIEVRAEYDGKRTNHEYQVFHEGKPCVASKQFGTQGKFTDKYSTYSNGKAKYINNRMYWHELRDEMVAKSHISENGKVFVFYDKKEFEEYRNKYNEMTSEKQNQEPVKSEYDFAEKLGIKEEVENMKNDEVVTSSKMLYCEELIRDSQGVLESNGVYLKGQDTLVHRASKDTYSISELKQVCREIPNKRDKAKMLIMIKEVERINSLSSLQNVQADIMLKTNECMNLPADSKECTELKNLCENKDKLIKQIGNIDKNIESLQVLQYTEKDSDKSAEKDILPHREENAQQKEIKSDNKSKRYSREQWQDKVKEKTMQDNKAIPNIQPARSQSKPKTR